MSSPKITAFPETDMMISHARSETRDALALRLRVDGKTNKEIASLLGVSAAQITRHVSRALHSCRSQLEKKHLYRVSMLRLEKAVELCMRRIRAGDIEGVNALVRVIQRQSAMAGLDEPIEFTGNGNIVSMLQGSSPADILAEVIRRREEIVNGQAARQLTENSKN